MNEDDTPDDSGEVDMEDSATLETDLSPDELHDVEVGAATEEPVDDLAPKGIELSGVELETPSSSKNSAFMGVPIEIIVSVGKARPLVSDLVNLKRDSVIALDSKIDDPVEIFIGDRLIARGELQDMDGDDGQLGVRLTEVADLSNGV